MTLLRRCEIAVITAVTGRLPTESKCCASRAWLVALSGTAGALQQLGRFTGALFERFAQPAIVGHAIADGALVLSGSSRAIRSMARERTHRDYSCAGKQATTHVSG